MCVIVVLIQNLQCDLDLFLLKPMLGTTNPNLRALVHKCELLY